MLFFFFFFFLPTRRLPDCMLCMMQFAVPLFCHSDKWACFCWGCQQSAVCVVTKCSTSGKGWGGGGGMRGIEPQFHVHLHPPPPGGGGGGVNHGSTLSRLILSPTMSSLLSVSRHFSWFNSSQKFDEQKKGSGISTWKDDVGLGCGCRSRHCFGLFLNANLSAQNIRIKNVADAAF